MKKIIIIMIFMVSLFANNQKTITVSGKAFPESQLLGEIISILIEENSDIKINRKFWLGGTLICFEAIQSGEIDIYVEYTGTAWTVMLKKEEKAQDKDMVYNIVKEEFAKKYNLHWGKPLGFNNTYVMVVNKEYPIETISDLQKVQKEIRLGLAHEFMNREDGFPSMNRFYGLRFSNVKSMDHGLSYRAIMAGEIDATNAYATDGTLYAYNLKKLRDDKNFFPPYYAAPIVYTPTLQKYPEIVNILDQLEGILDDAQMIQLNYQVEVEKKAFYDVAFNFLVSKKLVSKKEKDKNKDTDTVMAGILSSKVQRIAKQTKQHLFLVFISTFIAIFIGIPLGIFISKLEYLAPPTLAITGILQTIPSLAILAMMVPLFGIGFIPSIIALVVYALLPIVRNTYTGITSINPELKEAAIAMGMTHNQTLFMLEIPLATKFIMAGVRTAAVISVGTATLAAFIGGGGLGEFILTGISLNDWELILMGTIPAAALALIVDYVLAKAEYLLEPKGLKVAKG